VGGRALDHRDVGADLVERAADVERRVVGADHDNPLALLLRRSFSSKPALESAVRSWATIDPVARTAVQATDRRRLSYVESLFERSGLSPEVARSRAQIFYWAFLGFALSDKPLPRAKEQAVLEELLRLASR